MSISFSAMRKQLENQRICDPLKGRIKYFLTLYRKSNDGWEGSISILFEGKEIFKSNTQIWQEVSGVKWDSGERDYNKIAVESHNEGAVDIHSFYKAFYYYQNHSIEESLTSEDPLIRLFAVLDKRVGKRTLEKLVADLLNQPQWLQIFYKLRLEAEGII